MPVSSAKNIEIVFDQEMTLIKHVTAICKTCFLHLRNKAKITDNPSQKDTEIFVHAFVSSKLNGCNSLLYGLPQSRSDFKEPTISLKVAMSFGMLLFRSKGSTPLFFRVNIT